MNKFAKIFGYTIFSIVGIAFILGIMYGIWTFRKKVNYNLMYKDMVKQTIVEMVKEDCLKK